MFRQWSEHLWLSNHSVNSSDDTNNKRPDLPNARPVDKGNKTHSKSSRQVIKYLIKRNYTMVTKEQYRKLEVLKTYLNTVQQGYVRATTAKERAFAKEMWEEIKGRPFTGSLSCSRCTFNMFKDISDALLKDGYDLSFPEEKEEQPKKTNKKTKKTKEE